MPHINTISINSTRSKTDLCELGAKHGTDKSPYNEAGGHRHPYTAIYSNLFGSMRYKNLNFAEIGVSHNSSMKMWREYFPRAKLYGFEYAVWSIENAESHNLPDTRYIQMDAAFKDSTIAALRESDVMFDVIIDDASHWFDHQINVASVVAPFLKPGGIFIIEDIHRPWSNSRYEKALKPYLGNFHSCMFVEAEHEMKFSEGTEMPWFDNDKLFVAYRNDLEAVT